MDNALLINQTSGAVEYYTDPKILNCVRNVLGYIDLDPASSAQANKFVKANRYFTKLDNGLSKSWQASTLWMNHPFSKAENKLWIEKLVTEYTAKNFQEGMCITYAATSEKWFQPLMKYPQCYMSPRTNYFLPSGKVAAQVTKGSVITYLGDKKTSFYVNFRDLGSVLVPFAYMYT